MKVTKLTSLIAIAAALTLSNGCKHKPTPLTTIPNGGRTGPQDPNSTPPIEDGKKIGNDLTSSTPQPDPTQWANAHRDAEKFKEQTVHFAYDSTVIRSEDKPKIASVADYLKQNPSNGVEVDGHCDERGTDEYNRALGERRALAIREELIGLGVDAGHVMTVSFGRERPVDTGHSDAAHARNRRGEFVLLTPP
jgi:peptidoglycan-associated lipoprotein